MTTLDNQLKFARDLDEIVDLSTQLLTQAVNDARANVDGTSLPGGRAMIALAPVGDLASWDRRVEMAEAGWYADRARPGIDPGPRPEPFDEDDDSAPVLQILRYWSDRYRWELGMVWDHIPTINTEAKFLRNPDVVVHALEHHAGDWDHMVSDVKHARLHLESILYAGRRPDRTRVVCSNTSCTDPRKLIKVYGRRYVTGYTCTACATAITTTYECDTCHHRSAPSSDPQCRREHGRGVGRERCTGYVQPVTDLDHCPNQWCFTTAPPEPVWASDEADDRWKCTACKTKYDDDKLRTAHAKQLRHEKAERYVLLPEAVATLVAQGRNERVVRRWLEPNLKYEDQCTRCRKLWPEREHAACPRKLKDPITKEPTGETCGGDLSRTAAGDAEAVVQSWCDLSTRKVWVWWPDLWRIHLSTPTRRRRAS